jgi:hypothetical protein
MLTILTKQKNLRDDCESTNRKSQDIDPGVDSLKSIFFGDHPGGGGAWLRFTGR